jgi:hypothetical protein
VGRWFESNWGSQIQLINKEVIMTVVKGLTFSKALLGLQAGERLQREGWNGKNMWIASGEGASS